MAQDLLTRPEAARVLGCSTRTVQRMVDRGDIVQVKVGARLCRYRRADLEALINAASAASTPRSLDERADGAARGSS